MSIKFKENFTNTDRLKGTIKKIENNPDSIVLNIFDACSLPVFISDNSGELIYANENYLFDWNTKDTKILATHILSEFQKKPVLDIFFKDYESCQLIFNKVYNQGPDLHTIASYQVISFMYKHDQLLYFVNFVQKETNINFHRQTKDTFIKFLILQNHITPVEDYCNESLVRLKSLISFQFSLVYLYVPGSNEYVLASQIGLAPEIISQIQTIDKTDPSFSIFSGIIDYGENEFTNDIKGYPLSEFLKHYCKSKIKSQITVPLIYKNEVLGFVLILSEDNITNNRSINLLITEYSARFSSRLHEKRLTKSLIEKNLEYEQKYSFIDKTNKIKSNILLNLCNDIQKPISDLIINSSILFSGEYSKTVEEENIMKNNIIDNSHFLQAVIDDIIFLTKLESGIIDIDYSESSVENILNKTILHLEPLLESNQLVFTTNVTMSDQQIIVDSRKIAQIFQGILANAIRLSVKNQNIKIDISESDSIMKLLVQTKVDPYILSEMDKLFIPFHRINKDNPGSVGMGLYLVDKITEYLGGKIILGKIDNYLVYKLALPVVNKNIVNDKLNNSTYDCVILGNDYYYNKWLKQSFEKSKITARIIDKKISNDEYLYTEYYDTKLIILNLLSDENQIWEELSNIKFRIPNKNVQMIVISGDDVRRKAYQYGAVDYFNRPVNTNMIIQRINQLKKSA